MFKKTKTKFQKWIKDVIEAKTKPHEIALGFALGLFIGILPTPAIGVFLCLLMIFLFKVNKISIFAGFALINPATLPLVLAGVLWIGTGITGAKVRTNVNVFSRTEIQHMIKPLIIGDLILAFSTAIIAYIVVYFIFKKIIYKNKKKSKKKSQKRSVKS